MLLFLRGHRAGTIGRLIAVRYNLAEIRQLCNNVAMLQLPVVSGMARGSKSKDRPDDLMVRVPHDWLELLQAAQFVRRKESMQALLESVVHDFLAEVKDQPAVQLALKSRRLQDADDARSAAQLAAVSKSSGDTEGR